jgi:hypothetical protein
MAGGIIREEQETIQFIKRLEDKIRKIPELRHDLEEGLYWNFYHCIAKEVTDPEIRTKKFKKGMRRLKLFLTIFSKYEFNESESDPEVPIPHQIDNFFLNNHNILHLIKVMGNNRYQMKIESSSDSTEQNDIIIEPNNK